LKEAVMTDQSQQPANPRPVREIMRQFYAETDRRYPGLSPEQRRRRAVTLFRLYKLRHGLP
jgi:hypothetical protein